MRRSAMALALLTGLSASAVAAPVQNALNSIAAVLQDGYDIKSAFSDNQGGAYILLQKGTSSYMCHSNPNPRCEKLN